jgi:NADPH-dependent curcumin reductase CurA
MTSSRVAEQIVLASRPHGEPHPENFRMQQTPLPTLQPGQVLLQTLWLSLDPYMRSQMDEGKSYAPRVQLGEVMKGDTVSQVVESRHADLKIGDVVDGYNFWETFTVSNGTGLRKVDLEVGSISTALGVLGMPGQTAYTGLLNIGRPKQGETLVVAAASGPVGSLVGQIAKLHGCRVVGIAGGVDKCRYVREELGFDVALDHRAADLAEQLRTACPDGIDIYFENVGGHVWNAVFPLLNDFARIPVCGLVAHYSDLGPPAGPDRLVAFMRAALTKRWTVQGFIVSDFDPQIDDFRRDVSAWLQEGKIKYREDIVEGLANAPMAFIGLLNGRNLGKLLVRVSQ